jgi:hypothetical protein
MKMLGELESMGKEMPGLNSSFPADAAETLSTACGERNSKQIHHKYKSDRPIFSL